MHLREHPLRRQIVGEMHLRRWPRVTAPMRIIQVLRLVSRDEQAEERSILLDTPAGAGHFSSDNPRHAEGELADGLTCVWEQHSEACGVTLFAGEGVDLAPALRWLERFPGQVIRATRIMVVADEAHATPALDGVDFLASDLVSCHIGRLGGVDCNIRLWSDFRIGADGFGQLVIADGKGDAGGERGGGSDLARVLQTLQELGDYRNLALLGLPVAQANWTRLDKAEATLRQLSGDIAKADLTDDTLLDQVCALSLELMSITAETNYRLSATEAYARLVEERLASLDVRPIAGFPSLADFAQRRLLPAVRTCSAFGRRLDRLTAQAAHFTSLLRTRIETRIENQNARLMRSMERSASLQLRLQQLVEGLSVVALSYYVVSLVGYMLKGLEGINEHFPVSVVIATLVPLVVGTMWLIMHRMKVRLLTGPEPAGPPSNRPSHQR